MTTNLNNVGEKLPSPFSIQQKMPEQSQKKHNNPVQNPSQPVKNRVVNAKLTAEEIQIVGKLNQSTITRKEFNATLDECFRMAEVALNKDPDGENFGLDVILQCTYHADRFVREKAGALLGNLYNNKRDRVALDALKIMLQADPRLNNKLEHKFAVLPPRKLVQLARDRLDESRKYHLRGQLQDLVTGDPGKFFEKWRNYASADLHVIGSQSPLSAKEQNNLLQQNVERFPAPKRCDREPSNLIINEQGDLVPQPHREGTPPTQFENPDWEVGKSDGEELKETASPQLRPAPENFVPEPSSLIIREQDNPVPTQCLQDGKSDGSDKDSQLPDDFYDEPSNLSDSKNDELKQNELLDELDQYTPINEDDIKNYVNPNNVELFRLHAPRHKRKRKQDSSNLNEPTLLIRQNNQNNQNPSPPPPPPVPQPLRPDDLNLLTNREKIDEKVPGFFSRLFRRGNSRPDKDKSLGEKLFPKAYDCKEVLYAGARKFKLEGSVILPNAPKNAPKGEIHQAAAIQRVFEQHMRKVDQLGTFNTIVDLFDEDTKQYYPLLLADRAGMILDPYPTDSTVNNPIKDTTDTVKRLRSALFGLMTTATNQVVDEKLKAKRSFWDFFRRRPDRNSLKDRIVIKSMDILNVHSLEYRNSGNGSMHLVQYLKWDDSFVSSVKKIAVPSHSGALPKGSGLYGLQLRNYIVDRIINKKTSNPQQNKKESNPQQKLPSGHYIKQLMIGFESHLNRTNMEQFHENIRKQFPEGNSRPNDINSGQGKRPVRKSILESESGSE